MPLTVYTSQSLVSLKLREVVLVNPKSFVTLPSLKVIYLKRVTFVNDRAFEMLISGCPVLESLTLKIRAYDNVKVLRVCSQSLLSFTLFGNCDNDSVEELVVVIDAPRLEKLHLADHYTDRFIIDNIGSPDKVVIDVMFNLPRFHPNDLPKTKRNVICSFLLGISSVKDMFITSETLEVIYKFSNCEGVPLFRNLSSLRADLNDYNWDMLPIFLESCPNLKSLSLGFDTPWEQPISILLEPHSFLHTLESVEIVKPMKDDDAAAMILVSYFLENSTVLKKFTFSLDGCRKNEESDILKKLLAIPRLSTSCQVIVS